MHGSSLSTRLAPGWCPCGYKRDSHERGRGSKPASSALRRGTCHLHSRRTHAQGCHRAARTREEGERRAPGGPRGVCKPRGRDLCSSALSPRSASPPGQNPSTVRINPMARCGLPFPAGLFIILRKSGGTFSKAPRHLFRTPQSPRTTPAPSFLRRATPFTGGFGLRTPSPFLIVTARLWYTPRDEKAMPIFIINGA